MRIHSDILTEADVLDAARTARVSFDRFAQKGSRSRARAFDVTLEGASKRRPNNNRGGDGFAATWDQWGVFLGVLFARDPKATCSYYSGAEEFDQKTAYRFHQAGIWPADAHGDHTFRYSGVTGQQECSKCTAVQRWS